ncbi:P-loop containing nucleoside triphosphate hydrolase protein [Mycotypha africana]|uniref:P-loop containing nucleoside triphosphate hydrolase protein n=1 Tax=Mycotypha africana TaxID=64632 RepID=UPI0023017E91|nr:P-loop containing nucleoside triphosphate hydrolase protein [Mycotypha africana]KAI8981764.1 P-loop containing nucleoside triphosphate hydrolase protein [Mycotypha africana]
MDDEEIKQFSSDQRIATPDEPTCVVCGKYGEYINDDTDQDICSLECKAINSDLHAHRLRKSKQTSQPTIIGHIHDYVAENVHAKLTNYQEPVSIAHQNAEHVKQMLQAHDIHVRGSHIPKPFTTYDQLEPVLGAKLLQNIESLGWSMATSVQRQAVPIGLAGRDMVVIAPTYSGKTAAFLIPLLVHCQSLSEVDHHKRRAGPYALIMTPTRELCIQIENICKKLAIGLRNIRTALLIGGQPMANQLYRLKQGVQIIVGTPGRILEMLTYHPKLVRAWRIRMMVLDEADAMFHLGFATQIRQILGKFPDTTVRQTSYFSATAVIDDKWMQGLMRRLRSPVEVTVGQTTARSTTTSTTTTAAAITEAKLPEMTNQVRQTILWVENKSKFKRLLSILQDPKYFVVPVLVFVESRLGVEFLTRAIKKKYGHIKVISMHGDKTQEERAMIIAGINQPEPAWDVIISTDILARGMDLPSVKLVINYDMPATLTDYTHRIGRAILQKPLPKNSKQQRGWVITFINKEHEHLLPSIAAILAKKSPAEVTPLPAELKRYLK